MRGTNAASNETNDLFRRVPSVEELVIRLLNARRSCHCRYRPLVLPTLDRDSEKLRLRTACRNRGISARCWFS